MASKILNTGGPLVTLKEAKRFMVDCFLALSVPKDHAESMSDLLVAADYRGHYSHGMNRLEIYVNDLESGTCNGSVKPTIIKETPATAWVDGRSGLGSVVGTFCMNLAMDKAKQVGVGWVVAKGSNHFGIAGYYSNMASEQGLLGMAFTNTSPLMTPTRAKMAALGTNPLALSAPGLNKDKFDLDMATTAVALGKIEIQKRKGQPLPEGWALNEDGQVETNPEVAYNASRLMPLGGTETNSGYKGYGLGMLVEIFCGILGGSDWGPHVRKWGSNEQVANLGQCFIAVDPECFAPGFQGRLSELIKDIRGMEPVSADKPVMVAGDPEKLHMKAVDEAGGINYVENQLKTCEELAKKLQIKPLSFNK